MFIYMYVFRKILPKKQEHGAKKRQQSLRKFCQNVNIVYLYKRVPTEPDFSLLEWKFTDRRGEEARIIHMVID